MAVTAAAETKQRGETTSPTKGERTRASVVGAAVRRFEMDGCARTSIADVARDVGISAAAVYRYFPDKETLFVAAVDAEIQELVDAALPRLLADPGRSIPTMIRRMAESLAAALRDRPLVARVLSGVEPMPPQRILAISRLGAIRSELERLFDAGQKIDLVRRDIDAATLALGCETIFLYQLAHLAALRQTDDGAELDDERWQAVAEVVEAAIRPARGATETPAAPSDRR